MRSLYTLVFGLSLLLTGAAQAATATPGKADTGPLPTNTELHHFVDAVLAVKKIDQKGHQELKHAKTTEKRAQLKRRVYAKEARAVRDNHLTLRRYKQIYAAMQTDRNIRRKVKWLIDARRKASR